VSRVIEYHEGMESLGAAVVALGVFDGVHVGHQALVRDAVKLAEHLGVKAIVATFDRDPDRVLTPGTATPQLLPLEDKLELLAELDPSAVLVIPFNLELAALSPEDFLDHVLLAAVHPVTVVVGRDFRFGAHARGDITALESLGLARRFTVSPHELVTADGLPVTSTRIRALVASGHVVHAAELLGRPHRLAGRVVPGRGDGRRLGVPTANLLPPPEAAVPAAGVYACRTRVGDTEYAAGVSIGRPPTFPCAEEAVEAHLLGFSGDLYGTTLRLEFLERLRDLTPFESEEELTAAIESDLDRAAAAYEAQ